MVSMDNYEKERKKMVKDQLLKRGITDENVIRVMRTVERHCFVDEEKRHKAYHDSPVATDCSQTISQPYMVALMTQLLDLTGEEKVLEIGTGTGYQTAILAELSRFVFSIERHSRLAENARSLLGKMDYHNVNIRVGDGTLGLAEEAPFDAILVTAGAPSVPHEFIEQLLDYGRLVIPVGSAFQQELRLVLKRGDSYIEKAVCGCVFVPLIGAKGWDK